ncbi:ABC transporter permease [Salana multivorans]
MCPRHAFSLVTFLIQSLIPGDPAAAILGPNGTPDQYEELRRSMHLDQPVLAQYGNYMAGVLRGDLGRSLFNQEPVAHSLAARLPVTLSLLVLSLVVVAVVGTALGVASVAAGGRTARAVDALSLLGLALPNFWIALVLVSVFAVAIPLFPAVGYVSFVDSPNAWATALVLPVTALAIGGLATVAKVARDGVSTAMESDYTRTLRACGISRRSLLWRHALKNSGVGIATVLGIAFIGALSGSVFVETVFALPGLGSLVVEATARHDIPVIQGVALAFTLIVIVVNLVVDLSYAWFNPKIRAS